MLQKLVQGPFLKTQNWAYLWINSLKFYIFYFYCIFKSLKPKIYWNQGQPYKNVCFWTTAALKFLSEWFGWFSNRFYGLSSYSLMLNMISTPFVFVLSFFTLIWIRLLALALIFSPYYKDAILITTNKYPRSLWFNFISYFSNDSVNTPEVAIEGCSVNFKNQLAIDGALQILKINHKFIDIKVKIQYPWK